MFPMIKIKTILSNVWITSWIYFVKFLKNNMQIKYSKLNKS